MDDLDEQHNEQCNFGGRHLRVAVSPQPPFVDCLQDLYGDWHCNGSNIEVIRVLERKLNFRADWIVLASSNHDNINEKQSGKKSTRNHEKKGRKNLNETLTSSGIFGLVSTGRALLSANGVMRTLDRQNYKLIVSTPFDSFKLHFLLSKSVRDHDHIFVKPFNLNAWLAIFGSAALVVPIFYLINSTTLHYSIQDDKALRNVSFWSCLGHFGAKLRLMGRQFCCLARDRRASSTDSDLDLQITRMVESNEPPIDLSSQLRSPMKGEAKRRRRLVKRQWNLERKKARKVGRAKRRSGFFKIAYIVWYVVASLANQGGETEDLPHASSTRILVAFWWLYLIVICAIHSGILTAILTFPKQIDFIQTLDDYLNLEPSERMQIKLAVDKHSELAHLLSDPNNLHKSPLQALQDESVPMLYVDFQRHRQRILDDVQQGHSAFIEEKSIITQIISQEYFDSRETKCLFKASRYPVDVIPMSLIMSTKMPSRCVDLINSLLRRIMITGLAQKWRRKYDSMGNDCLNSVVINAGDVDKIQFKHVVLAFWLLLLGVCLGAFSLIGEIVWFFMTDDDDDGQHSDSSGWSSSCSSKATTTTTTTSDSDSSPGDFEAVQLGHRRALQGSGNKLPMRSLQGAMRPRSMLRRVKQHQKKLATKTLPKITFSADDNQDDYDEHDQVDIEEELRMPAPVDSRKADEKKRRRLARAAERRSKRIQKTMDFIKKVHGGKIYSDKMKSRVRRASHAIVGHLTGSKSSPAGHDEAQKQDIRSRVRQRQLQVVDETIE